jgi:hypothetical protein
MRASSVAASCTLALQLGSHDPAREHDRGGGRRGRERRADQRDAAEDGGHRADRPIDS